MRNKYQLEFSQDTHEENTVRFSTSIENLTNVIQRMQTTIESMSDLIQSKSEENRKIVRAYKDLMKDRPAHEDLN